MKVTEKTTKAQFVRDWRAAEVDALASGHLIVMATFFSQIDPFYKVSKVCMSTINNDGIAGLVGKNGGMGRDLAKAFEDQDLKHYRIEPYKY